MITSNDFCVAVVGPTASGKTALAIQLARRTGGEIVSCDSMQVYKDADIGTAKPTAAERAEAVHHLIDFLPLSAPYSAADYANDALAAVTDIRARGRLPIFCGGTGLYLEAARTGRHDGVPMTADERFRAELLREAETDTGRHALWERLREVDPRSAEATHENNVRRIIRALEIYRATGITKSEWDDRTRAVPPRLWLRTFLVDFHDRTLLHRRIDERVDAMMAAGLLDETRRLLASGVFNENATAAQAIGYKELFPYLRGECTLSDAVDALKTATRRYAKRQLTWFHAMPDTHILYADEGGTIRSASSLCDELLLTLAL